MKNKMMNVTILLLTITIMAGCAKKKEDSSTTSLIGLLGLSSRTTTGTGTGTATGTASREMYAGFAEIPSSIYQTTSTTTSSIQAGSQKLATTDYQFSNSGKTGSVAGVYNLVRGTAKTTRDIAKTIGELVKSLEAITVTATLEGSGKWAEIDAKYRYQTSNTVTTGGKKLEVWWNNGVAPYSNNKAIEMNYAGSSTAGNLNGFVFVRFLSKTGATTLSKAYIKFDYNATTKTRTMVVIMQDIGDTFTDRAHFYVQEVDGVTTMDGAYTIKNFTSGSPVAAADRVYVFNAAGDATKAVVNAALPLSTDTTTAIYASNTLGNIGQVWTNFIFANSTIASAVNSINVPACKDQISTTPNSGNPTTFTGVTTVATLKACLDAVITATGSTDAVKDVYFLTNIKNPAYFTVSGTTATLYGVESLEATDSNKSAFDTLYAKLLTSTRTTTNAVYPAAMDASTVSTLNLFTGTGIPVGNSATALTNLNAQWGNGTPGTGTSSATAGTNSVNGSTDNTAPF